MAFYVLESESPNHKREAVYNEKILKDILTGLKDGETEEDLDTIGMGRDK